MACNALSNSVKASNSHSSKKICAYHSSSGNEEVQVYVEDGKANPEEIVRQLWVYKLIHLYGYKMDEIDLEASVQFGTEVGTKAADIIVYTDNAKETLKIIVECKKPKRKDGIEQLKSYMNAKGAPVAVWSNGSDRIILYRPYPAQFDDTLSDIPKRGQGPKDVLETKRTLLQLERNFNFKKIIQDLEELVLADSGKDEFNEIFKLIFTKIWDEKEALENRKDKTVEFGQSIDPDITFDRINGLFKKACEEWPGIFRENEDIELARRHLQVCIGPITRVRLMGSNLRIMDDAFEYLLPTEAKKKKGQFFTPRHVVEMCVRMLNPTQKEYVMDPSCGSGGFLLHAMEWCYPADDNDKRELRKHRYASKYLWGVDFEACAAKTARALMLIGGRPHQHLRPRCQQPRPTHLVRERLRPGADAGLAAGLHPNTFKPHTGTKTSVLFVQKYTEQQLADIARVHDEVAKDCPAYETEIQALLDGNEGDVAEEAIPEAVSDLIAETFSEPEAEEPVDDNGNNENGDEEPTEPPSDEERIAQAEEKVDSLRAELLRVKQKLADLDSDVEALAQQQAQELDAVTDSWSGDKGELRLQMREMKATYKVDTKTLKQSQKEKAKRYEAEIKRLEKEIPATERDLKLHTNLGKLELILEDCDLIGTLKERWIAAEVAKRLDYPIFMAVSERGGKNNSGDYEYVLDEDGHLVEDASGQPKIDQDLVNYDLTGYDLADAAAIADGQLCVAEAFVCCAQADGFDFWGAE